MKTNTRAVAGFTLVEVMIVVAIIALLAVIALPNFVRARTVSQQKACINNLRQIDSVKQQWALEFKQSPGATPVLDDIAPYLRNALLCPAGGLNATFDSSYVMGDVGQKPTCKIAPIDHALPLDSAN